MVGRQRFEAGSQVSLVAHSMPPVPPHLHFMSNTSQLVPGFDEQSTPAQRFEMQVLVSASQTKSFWQTTPPRPPHLHTPSSGSQIDGLSQTILREVHRSAPPL